MTRLLLSIILLLFVASPAFAGRRFGLVSSTGQWLISPKFWDMRELARGLYKATSLDNTKALFNSTGEELKCAIPDGCKVSEIWISTADSRVDPQVYRLLKRDVDGKMGVIDKDGAFVIPLDDMAVVNYADGYFLGLKTFADKNTKTPFPEYSNVEQRLLVFDVHGKLRSSFSMSNDKCAYLIDQFHDGILIGWQRTDQRRYIYFDVATEEQLNIPPQAKAEEFKQGLLLVDGPRRGFLTKEGKRLGDRDFDEYMPFFGDFAVVGLTKLGVTKYGTIDRSGRVCIPPIYKRINHFAPNDLFAMTFKKQWFALDSHGKIIRRFPSNLEPNCTYGGGIDCIVHSNPNFSAWDDKRVVLDERGKITPLNAVNLSSDHASLVRIDKGEREPSFVGMKNRHGWILKPVFDFLIQSKDGNYIAVLQPQTFNSADWRAEGASSLGCDRRTLFNLLLRAHDLIGMPESQLVNLLGVEKRQTQGYRYGFSHGGGCGMSTQDLFFAIENHRVKRWCLCGGLDFGPIELPNSVYRWYETNVVSNGDVHHGEQPYVAKRNR